jgi:TRAP-type C4-dicarboxylate transport system permease small subunit
MGPERNTHIRNVAIIIALAVAVWLIPGGAEASAVIGNVLSIIFIAGLLFLGYRLYMENRSTIFGLEERQRGILYGSVALAAITLVATRQMWEAGIGGLIWLVLMGAAVWGVYSVWRAYREY